MRYLLQPVPDAVLNGYPYEDIDWVNVGPDRWRGRLEDRTSIFAVTDGEMYAAAHLYDEGVEERTESELQVYEGLEHSLAKNRGK